MQKVELPVKINTDAFTKVAFITSLDLNHVPFVFVITAIQSGAKHLFANFSRCIALQI